MIHKSAIISWSIALITLISSVWVKAQSIGGNGTVLSYSLSNYVEIYQITLTTNSLDKPLPNWSITGGTIDQQFMPIVGTKTYKVGIKWNNTAGISATGSVGFDYNDGVGAHSSAISVTIYGSIPSPSTSIQVTSNCGTTSVTRSTSPPNAFGWYWQTSSGGTRTDLGTSSTLVLSAGSDLYLRSRALITPSPWGSEQYLGSINVYSPINATINPTPTALIPFNSIGVLLNANTGTNFSYQWLKDGQFLSNELGSSLLAKTQGNYTVKISTNVCTATSEPTVVTLQNDYNYIIVRDIQSDKKADGSSISEADVPSLPVQLKAENITYFDGLGRAMQSVSTQASPNTKTDIVTPISYDEFGREKRKYLPYVSTATDGFYKEAGLTEQSSFYTSPPSNIINDPNPFLETVFEPSPLNRVLKQGAPGSQWQPNTNIYSLNDNTTKRRNEVNEANEVLLLTYNPTTGLVDGTTTFYGAGQLYANKTYDENTKDALGNEVIEYTDKEGRTVCKKVYLKTVNSVKQYASTYYVYDDLGNLVMVLPPEAVRAMAP
jgi:hypothetical protein